MRKFYLVVLLLLIMTLVSSCTPDPDYPMFYHKMAELEEPFNGNGYWFSHELVLNEAETLLYAPKTLRYDDAIYLNERQAYFIRKERSGLWGSPFTYQEPALELLQEIFNEEQ